MTAALSGLPALLAGPMTPLPATTLDGHLAPVDGRGWFRVERPGSWARRRLAGLLHLPAAGDAVPVVLCVRPATSTGTTGTTRTTVDRWERTFAGRRLTSTQHLDGDELVEHVGRVALRFAIHPDRCGLTSTGAELRVGCRVARLPRWATPQVSCRVLPAGEGRRHVEVVAATPGGRVLCRYGGLLLDRELTEAARP